MSAAALLFAGALWAQEGPLWMRHCAISPDGTTIAFTYKGDIFTVPVSGGKATQITTNPAFDTTPIWSPDSKQIAFASDRMGSLDVFIVSKEGGEPRRLTTFSGSETPVAFSDAGQALIYCRHHAFCRRCRFSFEWTIPADISDSGYGRTSCDVFIYADGVHLH